MFHFDCPPNIPPLRVNDFVFSYFTIKANLFYNFFASQCPPVVNSSTQILLQNTETNK